MFKNCRLLKFLQNYSFGNMIVVLKNCPNSPKSPNLVNFDILPKNLILTVILFFIDILLKTFGAFLDLKCKL